LEKGFPIYDALYIYCQLKELEKLYKDELASMDRNEGFAFLKSKIKLPPKIGPRDWWAKDRKRLILYATTLLFLLHKNNEFSGRVKYDCCVT